MHTAGGGAGSELDGTVGKSPRLSDVIYVETGRYSGSRRQLPLSLFKIDEDGKGASRVTG